MAYVHGKNTEVTVAATIVKAKESSLNRSRDSHDTTGYGDDGHTFFPGLTNGTFSMSGVYDNTASTGNIAVLETAWATDAAVAVVVYPEGNSSGKPTYTFSCVFTGFNFADPVDDMVQWTSEWQITGNVTVGAVGA